MELVSQVSHVVHRPLVWLIPQLIEKKNGHKASLIQLCAAAVFLFFCFGDKKIYYFIKIFFFKFKMFYQSLVIVATASEVRYDCCMFILVPMVLVYIVHKSSVQNFVQSLHVLKSKVSFYLNSYIATILGLQYFVL